MTFPTAGSEIYRNDAGEVLGWDSPSYAGDEYCDSCGGAHGSIACPMDDDVDYDEDHSEPEEDVHDTEMSPSHFDRSQNELDAGL